MISHRRQYEQEAQWKTALRRAGLAWAKPLLRASGLSDCILSRQDVPRMAYAQIQSFRPAPPLRRGDPPDWGPPGRQIAQAMSGLEAALGESCTEVFVQWVLRHWVDHEMQVSLFVWGIVLSWASRGQARVTPSESTRKVLKSLRRILDKNPDPEEIVAQLVARLGLESRLENAENGMDDEDDELKGAESGSDEELQGDITSFEVEIKHEQTYRALRQVLPDVGDDALVEFFRWAGEEAEQNGYSAADLGDFQSFRAVFATPVL